MRPQLPSPVPQLAQPQPQPEWRSAPPTVQALTVLVQRLRLLSGQQLRRVYPMAVQRLVVTLPRQVRWQQAVRLVGPLGLLPRSRVSLVLL